MRLIKASTFYAKWSLLSNPVIILIVTFPQNLVTAKESQVHSNQSETNTFGGALRSIHYGDQNWKLCRI